MSGNDDYFGSHSSVVPKITLNSTSNSRVHSTLSSRVNSPTRSAETNYIQSNKPAYKQIQIDYNSLSGSKNNDDDENHSLKLKNSVSFDTVALDIAGGAGEDFGFFMNDDEDDDDEDRDIPPISHDPELSTYLQPGRNGPGSSSNRLRSPSPSPFRDLSPMRSNSFSSLQNIEGTSSRQSPRLDQNGFRTDYPSVPSVDFNSLAKSFQHPDYYEYVKKTENERTLLVYISGRRHTWVALDYVISRLLRNGDHIVIVARVPSSFKRQFANKNSLRSRGNNDVDSIDEVHDHSRPSSSGKNRIHPRLFRDVEENIRKYVEFLIDDRQIVKFTTDIALFDRTSILLKKCVELYEPCTIITSTKPNLRFQRKHTWNTSKISDKLVKLFQIPITVVPAFTLNEFEISFFDQLIAEKKLTSNLDRIKNKLKTFDFSSSSIPSVPSTREQEINNSNLLYSRNGSVADLNNSSKINGTPELNNNNNKEEEEDDDESDLSSTFSDDEDSETSSVKNLTRSISNYKDILDKYIEDTEREPITKTTFLDKLNKVTDINHKISIKFSETSASDGDGAALVRSLTGLPELTQKKSMLDVLEPAKTNGEALHKLKTSLYSNGTHSPRHNGTPKTIKFSNDISSPDKLKSKTKLNVEDVNGLRKFKSHVEHSNRNEETDRSLSPSISQPQQALSKSLSESRVKTLRNQRQSSETDLSIRTGSSNDMDGKKNGSIKDRFKNLLRKKKKK